MGMPVRSLGHFSFRTDPNTSFPSATLSTLPYRSLPFLSQRPTQPILTPHTPLTPLPYNAVHCLTDTLLSTAALILALHGLLYPLPVAQAWSKVIPDRVYKRAMGALLSLVGGKICAPVLGAQDLGEEQTHALHRIFKTLSEAVSEEGRWVWGGWNWRS